MRKPEQPTLALYPPEMPFTLEEFAAWADSVRWTPAVTVPEQPHWYWAAPSMSDVTLRSAWLCIKEHGTNRLWPPEGADLTWNGKKVHPRAFTYLVVDEWEYWRAPLLLINRARPGRPV